MTVEEIEIQVTASVEEALKEFKKMLPALKEQMKQMQSNINSIDMKQVASKTQSAMSVVKQKINEIKGTNVDKTLQKQFERASSSVMSYGQQLEQTKEQLRQVYAQMDAKQENAWKQYTPEGIEMGNSAIEPSVNKALGADKEYQKLIAEEIKLNAKVDELNSKLQQARNNYSSIGGQVEQVQAKQNIFAGVAGKVGNAFHSIKGQLGGVSKAFGKLPNITAKITANIKQMGAGMKQGLGHILKYAGALFSLRGIYSVLSSSASGWMSSQNAGAKQMATNIDYMKNALGSALAPVIQFVTNLMYKLLKAVQSVVYALFRVNIFANASAKSYSSMAGSAKKAKKETKALAGIHDEINNVQKNDDEDTGGGSGSGAPSFDLSSLDSEVSTFAQKLYDFFKPLKESWDVYGPGLIAQVQMTASQVGYLLSSVWGSFENIITNGTVYTTLQLILAIIGNIAEAFANALNYHGNGDLIIQNIANALNNLLTAINTFVSSDMFQEWLNKCSDKLAQISTKLAEIDWQPIVNALGTIGMILGSLVLDALDLFIGALKWLSEHPDVATVLLAIAGAIAIVSTAISILSPILTTIHTIAGLLKISMLATVGIIAAIVAVIALVIAAGILLYQNWETIKEKAMQIWNTIVESLRPILEEMSGAFKEAWEVIKLVWDMVKPYFQVIWDAIKAIFSVVVEVIGGFFSVAWEYIKSIWNEVVNFFALIWAGIKAVFAVVKGILSGNFSDAWEAIKNVWNRAVEFFKSVWDGIKNVFSAVSSWFSNVFSSAWNAVKAVINVGITGIESMINNGIVAPLNVVLKGLNGIVSAAGKVIGIDVAIPTLSSVSIPRLAKGGVAYDETLAIFGEYSNASSNPEITAPQNVIRETVEEALKNAGGNNQKIELSVYVGNQKLGQILLDDLRSKKRQSGKDIEALVGG